MQTLSPKGMTSPGVAVSSPGPLIPKAALSHASAHHPTRHISSPTNGLHSSSIVSIHGLVPRAASRSGPSATPSPQRSFSVMQSAMKIPGLASALNLMGVNGASGHDNATNGASTNLASIMAAVGANGGSSSSGPGPDDASSQPPPATSYSRYQNESQGHPQPDQLNPVEAAAVAADDVAADAEADAVYDLAAAAAVSNGNPPTSQGQSSGLLEAMVTSAKAAAAAAVNGRPITVNGHANGHAHSRHGSSGGEEPITIARDAVSARAENNIMPYIPEGPSLAFQIREIATTLRAINALRLEYLDKIAQQEMQLEARDQALRARDESIQALEGDNAELLRSLGLLQSAKAEAEAEIQRLRAASTPAAIPTAESTSPQLAQPPLPAPSSWPSPATSSTSSSDITMPTSPMEPPSAYTTAAAAATGPLGPHPLTSPPAAVASDAPALATTPTTEHTPVPAAPPTPAPPPPPPPQVPEVVLMYRSNWTDAFLHVNVEGRGWTALPGLRMEHSGLKEFMARVQGRSMEFVLTNGQGDWDSPGGPGRNYRIDSPGEYRLQHGAIVQLKPGQP